MNTPPKLWTITDLAEFWQVSRKTAYRIVADPGFPQGMRISDRKARWKPEDVMRWSERQKG